MANYYRGDQPHLPRQELKHAGKKGMRWGISNNPAYKAVGNLAKGVLRNGRYFYDYVTGGSEREARAKYDAANKNSVDTYRRYGMGSKEDKLAQKRAWEAGQKWAKTRSLRKDIDGTMDSIRSGQAGKNVGNWLKDRRLNAQTALGNLGYKAKNLTVSGPRKLKRAAKGAGNWLNDRRNDANKWLKDRKREVGNLWDGKAGSGSGKSERDRYIDLANRAAKKGETQKAIAYSQAAKRLNQQYEKSIAGRAEKLGVTNAINKVRDWGSARKKNVEDFIDSITGKTAKRKAEAKAAVEASREAYRKKVRAKNLVEGYNRNKSRAKKAKLTADLEKAHNNVYVQKPGAEKYLPQNLYKKKKANYSKKYKV